MLDWFTTIPGILVICGAILLVIAIILFILGSKKSKDNMTDVNNINGMESMIGTPEDVPSIVPFDNFNTTNDSLIKAEEPVAVDSDVTVSNTSGVESVIQTEESVSVNNGLDSSNFTNPVAFDIPKMDNPVNSEAVAEPNNIYGAEVPTVNLDMPEEKTVSIYGGNDPLEATQKLPKIDQQHEPYGGFSEIYDSKPTVEMPTVEPVAPASFIPEMKEEVVDSVTVSKPTVEMPTVEPVAPASFIPEMKEEVVDSVIVSKPTVEMPTVEPVAPANFIPEVKEEVVDSVTVSKPTVEPVAPASFIPEMKEEVADSVTVSKPTIEPASFVMSTPLEESKIEEL